jgi:predicted O-methyltransferase YrrM
MNLDEEIKDIISVWRELVETKIIPLVKSLKTHYYEGNIFSLDKTYDYNEKFLDKQQNIILSCKQPNVKNVLNIGFNSGNSTILMLLSNPNIKITCVDINSHHYVEPCFDIVNNLFKNRIKFLTGNSINILKNLDDKFDLIHIDGSNNTDIVKTDIENSIKLGNINSILIMDDYDYEPIQKIWDFNTKLYNLSDCNFKIKNNIFQSIKIKNDEEVTKPNFLCFYTCFIGSNNNLSNVVPNVPSNKYDCYYFTNNKDKYNSLLNTQWIPVLLDNIPLTDDYNISSFQSKELKACPSNFSQLNKYKYTCYFDSKLNLFEDVILTKITNMENANKIICISKHPFIDGKVWDEYTEAINYQDRYYIEKEKYSNYINKKLSLGFKDKLEYHYTTNFIIRKNTEFCKIINNIWYEHIRECGIQCQISFFFIQQIFKDTIYTVEFSECYKYV